MDSLTDQQLLADYAERHAEAAFAELVQRHIDLVHSAALRMVRDPHLAEDVTQNAFLALAKNASRLTACPVLSGWLHATARNLAANAIRSDIRRRARELEAATMNDMLSTAPHASWEEIAPYLDAGLSELSAPDRDAVLLRYFQKKSAQEIAALLGVSAEAAQKRVSRGVERLREFFAQHGVSVGAGGLVVAVSTNAVQAAPVGLAATITTAAAGLAAGALASAAPATAAKAIAMTALQKILVTATVAVLAGTGIYEARQTATLRHKVNTLEQQQTPLATQIQQLQRERDEARTQLAALQAQKERLSDNSAELLRLRGMAGVARRANEELEQLRTQLAQQAGQAANNPVTGAMADAAKQSLERQSERRLSRMTASLHLTPEQAQAVRELLARKTRAIAAGMQQGFTGKIDKQELTRLAKEAGNTDDQIKALLTPDQLASFPAWQQEENAQKASLSANQELLQMQSTLELAPEQLDSVYAALYEVNLNRLSGKSNQDIPTEAQAVQSALDEKIKALQPLLTESQLENYRQQQSLQAKLIKDLLKKMESSGVGK